MTNFTTRITIAAATLVVAAGAASAQTMKAEIPFTFRAGNKVMPAGTYRVGQIWQQSGTTVFLLREVTGQSAAILLPAGAGDVNKAWQTNGTPVLAFECGVSGCSLAKIWTGASASQAYSIHQGKMGKDEPVRVALIEMRPEKSETSGVPVLYFLNREANRAAIALAQSRNDPPKAWQEAGNPVLSFRCGPKVCSLAGVWSGNGLPAYNFAAPKLDKNEPTHAALVVLRPGNSD